jgi:putative membrane protein
MARPSDAPAGAAPGDERPGDGRPADEGPGDDLDERFTLANERTFLAWIRTALALIGGGLAAGQLLEFNSAVARLGVSLTPIALGALVALTSYRRWSQTQEALRRGLPIPVGGLPRLLAFAIGALAIVVAVVVMVDALSS